MVVVIPGLDERDAESYMTGLSSVRQPALLALQEAGAKRDGYRTAITGRL